MFLTYSNDETNEIYRLNARETAPLNSFKDMYVADPSAAVKGGLSIAVPGAVKGYQEFHKKHGKITWKELWQPSIDLALNGYPLTQFFEHKIELNEEMIRDEKNNLGIYLNSDGSLKKMGDLIKNSELGETMKKISEKGGDEFYHGELVDDMILDMQDFGSILVRQDFEDYTVVGESNVEGSGDFSEIFDFVKLPNWDIEMVLPPAPSSGNILAFMLGIIDDYGSDFAIGIDLNMTTRWFC